MRQPATTPEMVERGYSRTSLTGVGIILLVLAVLATATIAFIYITVPGMRPEATKPGLHPNVPPPISPAKPRDSSTPDVVTRYYANVCRIRGVLTGIGELSHSQAQRHRTAYRIHTEQGNIKRVDAVFLGKHPTASHDVPVFLDREDPGEIWSPSRGLSAWVSRIQPRWDRKGGRGT